VHRQRNCHCHNRQDSESHHPLPCDCSRNSRGHDRTTTHASQDYYLVHSVAYEAPQVRLHSKTSGLAGFVNRCRAAATTRVALVGRSGRGHAWWCAGTATRWLACASGERAPTSKIRASRPREGRHGTGLCSRPIQRGCSSALSSGVLAPRTSRPATGRLYEQKKALKFLGMSPTVHRTQLIPISGPKVTADSWQGSCRRLLRHFGGRPLRSTSSSTARPAPGRPRST
jgi:hypothetical protein